MEQFETLVSGLEKPLALLTGETVFSYAPCFVNLDPGGDYWFPPLPGPCVCHCRTHPVPGKPTSDSYSYILHVLQAVLESLRPSKCTHCPLQAGFLLPYFEIWSRSGYAPSALCMQSKVHVCSMQVLTTLRGWLCTLCPMHAMLLACLWHASADANPHVCSRGGCRHWRQHCPRLRRHHARGCQHPAAGPEHPAREWTTHLSLPCPLAALASPLRCVPVICSRCTLSVCRCIVACHLHTNRDYMAF